MTWRVLLFHLFFIYLLFTYLHVVLFLVSNASLDVLHSESRLIDLRFFFLIWFEGSLRWKENLAQKAAAAFLRRQQDTTNLQKLVYGNGRIWTSWPRDPGMKRADDNYCCCCCCCCCFSFVFPVPTPLLPVSKLFQFLWFITVSLFLFSSCFVLSLLSLCLRYIAWSSSQQWKTFFTCIRMSN